VAPKRLTYNSWEDENAQLTSGFGNFTYGERWRYPEGSNRKTPLVFWVQLPGAITIAMRAVDSYLSPGGFNWTVRLRHAKNDENGSKEEISLGRGHTVGRFALQNIALDTR